MGRNDDSNYYKLSLFIYRWRGFLIAVSYGVISISITFFNKAVFAVYNFEGSNTLTFGQILFALIFLDLMKRKKLLDYEDFNVETAKTLLPLALSFCGMAATGLAALKYVNIPMFSALRRLTTFVVIAGQYLVLKKNVSQEEIWSVIVMVIGAMIAGWGDITFDLYGYLMTAINCLVTAAYLVLIAQKSQQTGLQTFGLMYYNNILSIPFMAIFTVATDWDFLVSYDQWLNIGFQMCFFMSLALAFLLNYCVFLCSIMNSPLTTSITGQLKNILSTVFGLFMFGGVVMTPSLTVGLTMSTVAGCWYGYIKYAEKAEQTRRENEKDIRELEEGQNNLSIK